MKRKNIRELTTISLLVAAMAVTSQIAIPTGAVPLTVQTFTVALMGFFLGAKKGALATLVYILLGVIGIPVFSNFQGGLHVIVGYGGGFVLGFLPFSFFCGFNGKGWAKIAIGLFGLLLCHLAGIVHYSYVSGLGLVLSFLTASLPFVLKDIFLTLCAYFFANALKKRLY